MNSPKQQNLENVIAEIQKKWGVKAIHKARDISLSEYVPTGFTSLDALLGGGLVRGNVTEIMGRPTSGMTTIALSVMASAQKMGDGVVYLDLPCAFDPAYALHCGVNLSEIVLVRDEFVPSLAFLFDVVVGGIPGVVIFNSVSRLSKEEQSALGDSMRRLTPLLVHTRCALLFLTLPSVGKLGISQYSTTRLRTTFDRWLVQNGDVYGYQAVVSS